MHLSSYEDQLLRGALGLKEDEKPFPWQTRLLHQLRLGRMPSAIDIPTGLGKTSVMAVWLVGRALGANLPRRLVYVVDRRAVVDQATELAVGLRSFVEETPEMKNLLGLIGPLPVSTLRGQYADNRQWLEEPSEPAIIVGTVDMIGSRLLFQGYGVSTKMRPYHAGLLGTDALLVLDESHLVPPFESLLRDITDGVESFGPAADLRAIIPQLKVISLSATLESNDERSFTLDEDDRRDPIVAKRLHASKRLSLSNDLPATSLPEELAERAWELTASGAKRVRCVVFCDKREDAKKCKDIIDKLARRNKNVRTELFVGGRRVYERQEALGRLMELGFIAGSRSTVAGATFLFATSAAEVGIDLDADAMVCDLVPWERMVQRLGRVNRRGDVPGGADVVVISKPPRDEAERLRIDNCRTMLTMLPASKPGGTSATFQANPANIYDLVRRVRVDDELSLVLRQASSPTPIRPAVLRALIDAWSLTSLREHPGRPKIDPWLRGWVEHDPPQTRVAWRWHLPVRLQGDSSTVLPTDVEAFFEAAPLHLTELLETETFSVVDWLKKRVKQLAEKAFPTTDVLQPDEFVAIALTKDGTFKTALTLRDIENLERKDSSWKDLEGSDLVVDRRIGGLTDGLLDADVSEIPATADGPTSWNLSGEAEQESPLVPFRVKIDGEDSLTYGNWREGLRLPARISEAGETLKWLCVLKWGHLADTEEGRSSGNPQFLDEHQECAEKCARQIATALLIPEPYVEMLAVAARLHDEGKRSVRWQRAFHAATDGIYAKTKGPIDYSILDGYRHELRSAGDAISDSRITSLDSDLRDLLLHIIAAHHGKARPTIETRSCDDAPPSVLAARAQQIALMFARLQQRWGPWGLAWWEALLRAADQQASRKNETEHKIRAIA